MIDTSAAFRSLLTMTECMFKIHWTLIWMSRVILPQENGAIQSKGLLMFLYLVQKTQPFVLQSDRVKVDLKFLRIL